MNTPVSVEHLLHKQLLFISAIQDTQNRVDLADPETAQKYSNLLQNALDNYHSLFEIITIEVEGEALEIEE